MLKTQMINIIVEIVEDNLNTLILFLKEDCELNFDFELYSDFGVPSYKVTYNGEVIVASLIMGTTARYALVEYIFPNLTNEDKSKIESIISQL